MKIHHSVYLWIAALIFSASNSVTRRISELGQQHLVDGRNPISLCNVLFVGNLCALILMTGFFVKQWKRQNWQELTWRDWVSLVTVAMLSGAFAPALVFAALDSTNVTNVVLFSRLEQPLALAIGWLFFKVKVSRLTSLASIVGFVGVAVTVLLNYRGGLMLDRGSLLVTMSAIVIAISSNLTQRNLQRIELIVFSWIRTAIGTVLFFGIALRLYGSHHFMDAFSPFLWQWMILYSAVIVCGGQLCWFAGFKRASSAEVTLANLLRPIAAIGLAFLILGETPTSAQWVGGGIMIASLVMSAIDTLKPRPVEPPTLATEVSDMSSFRGI
jgi:drug/metabolite transporter (DMT)-like permease